MGPVVESVRVGTVCGKGVLGVSDDVVNLPAGGGSGKNRIVLEALGAGDSGRDGQGGSGSVGSVGHQFDLKLIII